MNGLPTRVAAALLVIWEPLNFALRGMQVQQTLTYRSWPAAAELGVHGLVALFCAGAGRALWNGAPDARRLAQAAIIVSVARVLFSLYWTALPSNRVPGHEPIYAAIALTVGGAMSAAVHFSGRSPSEPPSR